MDGEWKFYGCHYSKEKEKRKEKNIIVLDLHDATPPNGKINISIIYIAVSLEAIVQLLNPPGLGMS